MEREKRKRRVDIVTQCIRDDAIVARDETGNTVGYVRTTAAKALPQC